MKKLLMLSLFIVLTATACTGGDKADEISLEDAKIKAASFINDYLMGESPDISIKEAVEENGLYKVVVNMADGKEVNSYISKDGETFFPSGTNIEEYKKEVDSAKAAQTDTSAADQVRLADLDKTAKPKVELFVMSHCPYGTQMEKGILPVLETLGDNIDFELKFCDYAMHGEKELDEELSQYCIQKNNPEKLQEYLYCFLEDGDGEACLSEVGINKTSHSACVAATDKEYKISELFADRSTWRSGQFPLFPIYEADNQAYGVTGSPGLVVNGKKISTPRDSASILETLCAGFEDAPDACNANLSSASPSSGFGFGATSASGADASCGS